MTPPEVGTPRTEVYLCRASGDGSHDFRVCETIEEVLNFYCEMFGTEGREDEHKRLIDPDEWGGEGGLWYGPLDMYCATWEVWKVEAAQLNPLSAVRTTEDKAA